MVLRYYILVVIFFEMLYINQERKQTKGFERKRALII